MVGIDLIYLQSKDNRSGDEVLNNFLVICFFNVSHSIDVVSNVGELSEIWYREDENPRY